MKKIFLVLIILLMCSCANEREIYDEIIESGYGVGWGGNPDGIVCEEIKDAIYLTNNYFLTSEGRIYKFNETKLFSNEKNCIEASYPGDYKIKFGFNGNLYDANNKKVLAYDYDNSTFISTEQYKAENGSEWYDQLNVIKADYDFISQNDCGSEIMYIKDNNIYKYKEHYDDKTNQYVADEPLSLGSIPKDEKVIYMAGAIIKTDKNIYELTKINEEECNKYVDVKCKVEFQKSELSNIYNKIIFVSQERVVDDKYRMYGKGYCFNIEDK